MYITFLLWRQIINMEIQCKNSSSSIENLPWIYYRVICTIMCIWIVNFRPLWNIKTLFLLAQRKYLFSVVGVFVKEMRFIKCNNTQCVLHGTNWIYQQLAETHYLTPIHTYVFALVILSNYISYFPQLA